MKKIIHLSDLHFGTEEARQTNLLIQDCLQLKPDLIIISGDLTQRATEKQFQAVKQFLSNFEKEKILCVPGNHDISLYHVVERFFYPFSKYKKWISPVVCSTYLDESLAVFGINSVTPFKRMGGYITDKQLLALVNFFEAAQPHLIKIVVMHHNLIKSERHQIINEADKIIRVLAKVGVNIVLSGHIHYPWIEKINKNYLTNNLYIITAGTPISHRTIKPNSYNIIEVIDETFRFTIRNFDQHQFISEKSQILKFKNPCIF